MPKELVVPPQLDEVGRLLADTRRLRMLWALGDGRAYTATELARVAGLAASAASNHLTKLVEAGCLEVRSQGRHRYFTLTREDIGRAVEAMAAVAIGTPAAPPPRPSVRPALRHARRCYGHLAGECGVALWDALTAAGLLHTSDQGAQLSAPGRAWLAGLGVDPAALSTPSARPCLDWTERRWHLGGALGRALLQALQADGVFSPSPAGDRVLLAHPHRWRALLRSAAEQTPQAGSP